MLMRCRTLTQPCAICPDHPETFPVPRIIFVGQSKTDQAVAPPHAHEAPPEDDRPPVCPVCTRRLAIIGMRAGRDADGGRVRRQLWGCPTGHATTFRTAGVFGPFDILIDASDDYPGHEVIA